FGSSFIGARQFDRIVVFLDASTFQRQSPIGQQSWLFGIGRQTFGVLSYRVGIPCDVFVRVFRFKGSARSGQSLVASLEGAVNGGISFGDLLVTFLYLFILFDQLFTLGLIFGALTLWSATGGVAPGGATSGCRSRGVLELVGCKSLSITWLYDNICWYFATDFYAGKEIWLGSRMAYSNCVSADER